MTDQAATTRAPGKLPGGAGNLRRGGGRPKGVPNKVTNELRQAIKQLTDGLAPELDDWIRRGAKKHPLAAASLVVSLLEFAVPKLQRMELTGANGEPLKVQLVKGL